MIAFHEENTCFFVFDCRDAIIASHEEDAFFHFGYEEAIIASQKRVHSIQCFRWTDFILCVY